ncbi:MAG: HAMP domain-containing histidine kinase, partial [Patescibacteria group bacterium]|nr:HAMP domain-containing histidine kinase [Patescibacteria group bacterium]
LGIKTTQIRCKIEKGKIFTRLIDKGSLVVEFEEDNKYKFLDNITVNIFYLSTEAKAAFTRIMGIRPIRYGSIFLYRNGFRVYSYGDEGNDWLGLERRKGQGYARFLSGREVMGRIELHDIQKEFRELSSRSEGLVKTPAYLQLMDFFTRTVLRRFERYVVEGISWDEEGQDEEKMKENSANVVLKIIGKEGLNNIHFGTNLLQILKEKKASQIPEIVKNFEAIKKYVKSKEQKKYIEKQVRAIKSTTKTLARQKEEYMQMYEAKSRESLFLEKAISSDKDQLFNLIHSIKISAQAIDNLIYKINRRIKQGAEINSILRILDEVSVENQKVHRIATIVSKANFDLRADTITKDLVQHICQYLELGSDKTLYDIDFRFINEDVVFETEFQPIEILLILDNFISNSSKADANIMTIQFERVGKNLRILFGDNGKGIAKSDEKFLFTRGFTTSKTGSGLGLHYNKFMIESKGGTLRFLGNNIPGMGKGACFEVILH